MPGASGIETSRPWWVHQTWSRGTLARRVGRDVDEVRAESVEGIAAGPGLDDLAVVAHHVVEREGVLRVVARVEFVAEVVAGEGQRPARVLLLEVAGEVGGEGDLRLDLLLAVAEVIVGDDRDDHPGGGAAGQLEGTALVVTLIRVARAHAVAPLPLARRIPVRQAEVLLGELGQVRGEDDAAGVPRPVLDVQPGVVLGEGGVAGVAEDRLDEVEVAHQAAGREEAGLHRPGRAVAGDLGADDRPEQQRDEGAERLGPVGRERDDQQVGRRRDRGPEQRGEDRPGDGLLVARDRQAPLGDVERPLRGAPVALRVVQHAVAHPVRADVVVAVDVRVIREREQAGEPVAREDQRLAGQAERRRQAEVGEVVVQEGLDPPVGRALRPRRPGVASRPVDQLGREPVRLRQPPDARAGAAAVDPEGFIELRSECFGIHEPISQMPPD